MDINVVYNGLTPEYKSSGASGFDLGAMTVKKVYQGLHEVTKEKLNTIIRSFEERGYIKLRSGEKFLFGTGLLVEIPEGLELQIRPRSGTSLKKNITLVNSPGTIDSDYRGEIGLIIANNTKSLQVIEKGERIAQGVFTPVVRVNFIRKESLSNTNRGADGFGSTGTK